MFDPLWTVMVDDIFSSQEVQDFERNGLHGPGGISGAYDVVVIVDGSTLFRGTPPSRDEVPVTA